eukprot:jgi/Mesvir1/6616/Mv12750-RA.2
MSHLQLIDGDGHFDDHGLAKFVKRIGLPERRMNYNVVAIMGPQSSGKSTLLNSIFGTGFTEMDAYAGRSQTTRGVWLEQAEGIQPCTLVFDLEGNDSSERGEDGASFERQIALLALAVSDTLLVNMWCHDIGREHASNKPLLRIVFQVYLRMISPRRTTLLFVVRDKTKTPMDKLEPILRNDIQQIWRGIAKPDSFKDTSLEDFFEVIVTAVDNYEEKPESFKEQTAELRERFSRKRVDGGLACDRSFLPGDSFALSVQHIWEKVLENRDLDLPAHKVMVATVRCNEIMEEILDKFAKNEAWRQLEREADKRITPGFGKKVATFVQEQCAIYDEEASYFDGSVRKNKRTELQEKLCALMHPAFLRQMALHRSHYLDVYRAEVVRITPSTPFAANTRRMLGNAAAQFEKAAADMVAAGSGWDVSITLGKLRKDMEAHTDSVREERLKAIEAEAQAKLRALLAEPVASVIDTAPTDMWACLRTLMRETVGRQVAALGELVEGYELADRGAEMKERLWQLGKDLVADRIKEAISSVHVRVRERFNQKFIKDSNGMPRLWNPKDNIPAITRAAKVAAARLLATLAVWRLDADDDGSIEQLVLQLVDEDATGAAAQGTTPTPAVNATSSPGALASGVATAGGGDAKGAAPKEKGLRRVISMTTWENVDPEKVLLSPVQCKTIWRSFDSEVTFSVSQALVTQEAARRANSTMPPWWALAAIVLLGFNEFMAVLRNPFWLLVLAVFGVLARALWQQMNIMQDFQFGLVPGIMTVVGRILPTASVMVAKLINDAMQFLQNADVGGSASRGSGSSSNPRVHSSEGIELTAGAGTAGGADVPGSGSGSQLRRRKESAVDRTSTAPASSTASARGGLTNGDKAASVTTALSSKSGLHSFPVT